MVEADIQKAPNRVGNGFRHVLHLAHRQSAFPNGQQFQRDAQERRRIRANDGHRIRALRNAGGRSSCVGCEPDRNARRLTSADNRLRDSLRAREWSALFRLCRCWQRVEREHRESPVGHEAIFCRQGLCGNWRIQRILQRGNDRNDRTVATTTNSHPHAGARNAKPDPAHNPQSRYGRLREGGYGSDADTGDRYCHNVNRWQLVELRSMSVVQRQSDERTQWDKFRPIP